MVSVVFYNVMLCAEAAQIIKSGWQSALGNVINDRDIKRLSIMSVHFH